MLIPSQEADNHGQRKDQSDRCVHRPGAQPDGGYGSSMPIRSDPKTVSTIECAICGIYYIS